MSNKVFSKESTEHYNWGERCDGWMFIENETIEIKANEGLHIEVGKKHRISNNSEDDLEFILSSQPTTKGDRINL